LKEKDTFLYPDILTTRQRYVLLWQSVSQSVSRSSSSSASQSVSHSYLWDRHNPHAKDRWQLL